MNKDYIENINCYAQDGKLRAEARIYHSPPRQRSHLYLFARGATRYFNDKTLYHRNIEIF